MPVLFIQIEKTINFSYRFIFFSFVKQAILPAKWSTVGKVKDLVRIQQLSKTSYEMYTLASTTFDIDEDEQRTNIGR